MGTLAYLAHNNNHIKIRVVTKKSESRNEEGTLAYLAHNNKYIKIRVVTKLQQLAHNNKTLEVRRRSRFQFPER